MKHSLPRKVSDLGEKIASVKKKPAVVKGGQERGAGYDDGVLRSSNKENLPSRAPSQRRMGSVPPYPEGEGKAFD